MNRIIVGIDFSSHSRRALAHAAALACLYGSELELLTSAYLSILAADAETESLAEVSATSTAAREQVSQRLEALAEELRAGGIAVSCQLESDVPAHALCERAAATEAALIAMGTRGRRGVAHAVFGSVAERTARTAPCPVLTAHADSPEPTTAIDRILVPTDFSPHADAALDWAAALAARCSGRIALAHAAGEGEGDAGRAQLEKRAERISAPLDVELIIREGDPGDVVLALAEELDARLIVMGTRGRRGLEHWILGSIAERVIRCAHPPVVSLKQGQLPSENRGAPSQA